jgi:hypothetical protein
LDEVIKKSEDPEDPLEVGPLLKRKSPLPHQSIPPIPQSDVLPQCTDQHSAKKHLVPVGFSPTPPPPPPQSAIYSGHKNRGVFWIFISAILTFLLLSLISLTIFLFTLV